MGVGGRRVYDMITVVPGVGSPGVSPQPPLDIGRGPQATTLSETRTGVTVQWASSLTIRQATVREAQLKGAVSEEGVKRLLGMTFQQHVVVVRGARVPILVSGFKQPDKKTLQKSAFLELKGSKRKIEPLGIEVNLEGDPAGWFYFPRELNGKPVFPSNEKKVEFVWQSDKDKISATFDLSRMTRGGKPDL